MLTLQREAGNAAVSSQARPAGGAAPAPAPDELDSGTIAPLVAPRLPAGTDPESVYRTAMALIAAGTPDRAVHFLLGAYQLPGREFAWLVTRSHTDEITGDRWVAEWEVCDMRDGTTGAVLTDHPAMLTFSTWDDGGAARDRASRARRATDNAVHQRVYVCPSTVPEPGDRPGYARFVNRLWHEAHHLVENAAGFPRPAGEFVAYWAQVLNTGDLPSIGTDDERNAAGHALTEYAALAPADRTPLVESQHAQLQFLQAASASDRAAADAWWARIPAAMRTPKLRRLRNRRPPTNP